MWLTGTPASATKFPTKLGIDRCKPRCFRSSVMHYLVPERDLRRSKNACLSPMLGVERMSKASVATITRLVPNKALPFYAYLPGRFPHPTSSPLATA